MTYEDHIRAMAEARATLQGAEAALRAAENAEEEARNRSGMARLAFNEFVQEGVRAHGTAPADALTQAVRS